MPFVPGCCWRNFLALSLLGLLLPLGHGLAHAGNTAPVARIDASVRSIELWPSVRLLAETDREFTAQQALQRAAEFISPIVPYANLGARRDAVWFLAELAMTDSAPAHWIFDVDYPSIDRIDLYQISDGAIVREARLGDEIPLSQRPLPSRSHAVELTFKPGQRHALLLRVKTTSAMIVPLALSLPGQFAAREAGVEALQGMFAGIGVFLLIYSLARWLALRDGIFGYYAASIAGISLFFLTYNGLAAEHLWSASPWLTGNAAPLSILVALCGGCFFLERILRIGELSRLVSRLMLAIAWLALAAGLSFVLGLIDYRTAQTISTVLGPLPMLLGVPVAYVRMRRGDRIMAYLLAGWVLYSLGVGVMAALLRGLVPFNAWTQHAFQLGSMLEMTLWLVLLGERVREIRRTGEEAHREHDALRSLALTDALTGLANRRGLEPALVEAVQGCQPTQLVAVFMIDLDGFKQVNDRHGHDAGDLLLIAVAKRLKWNVRRSDFVARLGGDEFVVVATGLSTDAQARQFGQNLLDDFDAPFTLRDGTVCIVSLTIGYVLAPSDGRDPRRLLQRADAAMYAGKQSGKHCLLRDVPPVKMAASLAA
ncbi:MAG: diguanylate cyclase [Betaproteobacteria bacterium]